MDYEKLYKEAKDRMSKAYNSNRCTIGFMNEIFPELEDNKDERIRIFLTKFVKENMFVKSFMADGFYKDEVLAWLEKQGEHANFLSKIQVGDKVTRNEDGMLVNLSQLNRVAKKDEKQGEQKPAEWSEKDEKTVHLACEFIRHHSTPIDSIGGIDCSTLIERLKSLRPQWKPSEEQMKCLDNVKGSDDHNGYVLNTLYNDLKKLREE